MVVQHHPSKLIIKPAVPSKLKNELPSLNFNQVPKYD